MSAGAAAVAELAAEARSRAPRAGRTRVVAVDGRSGSGKSTFAYALADALGAPLVTLEDLYGGWDGLRAGIERLAREVLEPLARTGTASVPRYDWWRAAWAAPWRLEAPETLVVEGVGAASRPVAAYASLAVWLELDAPTRRRRALARDDRIFEPYWEMWAAQEEALLGDASMTPRADVVLDGAAVLEGLLDGGSPAEPAEARHTARVLLADESGRVLLMEVRDPATGVAAWSAPGGGIEPGEDARAAARREVREETGLADLALGPEVWRRHEAVSWDGRAHSYRERWFLARVTRFTPDLAGLTSVERAQVVGWRWWELGELAATGVATVPEDLPARAAALLAHGPPTVPEYG